MTIAREVGAIACPRNMAAPILCRKPHLDAWSYAFSLIRAVPLTGTAYMRGLNEAVRSTGRPINAVEVVSVAP